MVVANVAGSRDYICVSSDGKSVRLKGLLIVAVVLVAAYSEMESCLEKKFYTGKQR